MHDIRGSDLQGEAVPDLTILSRTTITHNPFCIDLAQDGDQAAI
jgi:hypothetical protein